MLAKKAPPTTRKLTFGDNVDQISWHHTGSLAKLWKGVPNLRTLEIETGEFDVGKMVAPVLERAIFITGGLSKACAKNIATATMPKIKHLEIYYGDEEYGGNASVKEVKPRCSTAATSSTSTTSASRTPRSPTTSRARSAARRCSRRSRRSTCRSAR